MKEDQELDGLPGHSEAVSGAVGGEAATTLVEKLEALAARHFAESNDNKRPQWHRKAHSHAWAGVCQAINLVRSDAPTTAAPDLLDALSALLMACEEDCGIPSDCDADDEAVGAGEDGDMALTFGMLRRGREALEKALGSSAHDTPDPRVSPGTTHEDSTP